MADLTEAMWRIHNRAARLDRMVRLGAPPIIIEWMRRLLVKSVTDFPVDPEIAKMCDETSAKIAADQAAWERDNAASPGDNRA
jgi:DNA-directed RNA polymerase beta' subunit